MGMHIRTHVNTHAYTQRKQEKHTSLGVNESNARVVSSGSFASSAPNRPGPNEDTLVTAAAPRDPTALGCCAALPMDGLGECVHGCMIEYS